MTDDCSTSICGLLKGKDVLSNISALLELLFLAFMKYIGACGAMKDIAIVWPSENERKKKLRLFMLCKGFPIVVVLWIALFCLLEFKPQVYAEDYWKKKGYYVLHSLVFCVHLARICYITVGWPRSIYDNRAWMT